MAQTGLEQKKLVQDQQEKTEQQMALKGTLASVMILGALIVISWFAMFALFMSRQ
ncbi:MAG: cytochrome c oxidase subunit 2A [Bacillaceae bacterium]|nr:cytochrome c oxidase subunit 2A [Bacillaceae bacterium]